MFAAGANTVLANTVLAITVDGAKNLAIAITVGFVALSAVSAVVVKKVTTRIVTVLVLAGFALGVWTQRSELQDCAQRVRDKASVNDTTPTTCTFFGVAVDAPDRT